MNATAEDVPVAPSFLVRFEESECVTTSGTTTVTYVVLYDRVWLSPSRIPGARVEQLARVPQVIWRREVTVQLKAETLVERITSRPQRSQATTADVLLGKAKGLARQTRRTACKVGPRGELVPR